jgi:hypothetical protein
MTRQLRDRRSFHCGVATVELAVEWKQDRRHGLSGQETFSDPGFIPPDPRVLLDEFLKLAMEDRDAIVAFLERGGYRVDDPRPEPMVACVGIEANRVIAKEKEGEELASGLRRLSDKEFGVWNFPLDSSVRQTWSRRRHFLERWLIATGSEIPTALVAEFREEVEDANRAFRSGLAWISGAPRLSLFVADAWEAMLAVVHIQKMMSAPRRICARPGCTKLVLITSGSGQRQKYCCKNCRLANNSKRYRHRQRK